MSQFYMLQLFVHFKFNLKQATRLLSPPLGAFSRIEQTFLPKRFPDTNSKPSYSQVHLFSAHLSTINKQNNIQRTWPSKTVCYSTFHNTVCQRNRQTIKTAIDVFNFVYYSFVHSMRPHIMSVADLELNYIPTLLTFPWYTKQTEEHKAWHFSIFVTSTYSINWIISSYFLWNIDKLLKSLTSDKWTSLYKRALHKCKPFGMTKTH